MFYIYFMMRRILWEMGGIQSVLVLLGDQIFSWIDNDYDKVFYKRVCDEFEICFDLDFCCKKGVNFGFGKNIYLGDGYGFEICWS